MTNQQILKKAIEKAVKNGFDEGNRTYWTAASSSPRLLEMFAQNENYYSLVFSHDFAKAFWGEKPFKHLGARVAYSLVIGVRINYDRGVPAWIYHIQKMVIHPDPIKYLEKFL